MSFTLFKKFGKTVLVLEAAAFVGSYMLFTDLNNSAESRRKMAERAPWLMDAFYKVTGHNDEAMDRSSNRLNGARSIEGATDRLGGSSGTGTRSANSSSHSDQCNSTGSDRTVEKK